MILYERPTSGHSYKIRLLLSALGITYESVTVLAENGRNVVDDDYLKLNPRGQIPTLRDRDLVLWGSTSILYYIASRFDSARRWLPDDVGVSAQVFQWMEFAQNDVQGLFLSRAISKFGYAGDLESARKQGNRALDILDDRLSDHEWLVGDHPTIADISCFPYVAVSFDNGFDLSSRSAVANWVKRMTQIDGFVGMPGMEPLAEYLG